MKILLSLLPFLLVGSISSMEIERKTLLDLLPADAKNELKQFIAKGNLNSLERYWIDRLSPQNSDTHMMLGRPDQRMVMHSFTPQLQDFSVNHELKKANIYQIYGLLSMKEQLIARNSINPATVELLSFGQRPADLEKIKNYIKKYVKNPAVTSSLVGTTATQDKKKFLTII